MVPPNGGLKNKMSSNICIDGTPNGYAVYEIQGSNVVNQYYKSTNYKQELSNKATALQWQV